MRVEFRPFDHHTATSSIRAGSSSTIPVLLTRLDTGQMRTRSSGAGLRSSVPAAAIAPAADIRPIEHHLHPIVNGTRQRVRFGDGDRTRRHKLAGLRGFHRSQKAEKLSTSPSAALMK
jgi:hypothetical protein